MNKWDHELPNTKEDAIELLIRRIEVHEHWRDYSSSGSDHAKSCEAHGTGTVKSHQQYINQYSAIIDIIKGCD